LKKILKDDSQAPPCFWRCCTAKTPEKVSENWEKIKLKEKGGAGHHSVLSSIPQSLPALLRASMVSERAAKTGFDWDDISGVMAKTMEEWEEFSKEVNNPECESGGDKAAMEFGDILFTMVNVARFARIHPETALIRSIQKFEKRFIYMEEKAIEAGRDIDSLTLQEMHGSGMRPKKNRLTASRMILHFYGKHGTRQHGKPAAHSRLSSSLEKYSI
jgi:tetrapyrrole methylase family protein/MazG family protein